MLSATLISKFAEVQKHVTSLSEQLRRAKGVSSELIDDISKFLVDYAAWVTLVTPEVTDGVTVEDGRAAELAAYDAKVRELAARIEAETGAKSYIPPKVAEDKGWLDELKEGAWLLGLLAVGLFVVLKK